MTKKIQANLDVVDESLSLPSSVKVPGATYVWKDDNPENRAIIDRMKKYAGMSTLTKLAAYLNVSKQIISTSVKLQKPPLALIMRFVEVSGASYDYILKGSSITGNVAHIENGSVCPIGLSYEYVKKLGVEFADIRFKEADSGNTIYLIHLGNKFSGNGQYAFNSVGGVVIFDSEIRLDGKYIIDGTEYQTPIEPVGKVVAVLRMV